VQRKVSVAVTALVLLAPSAMAQVDKSGPRRFLILADSCTVLGSMASNEKTTTFEGEKVGLECVFSGKRATCSDIAGQLPSTTLELMVEDRAAMVLLGNMNFLMVDRLRGRFLWAQTQIELEKLAVIQKHCIGMAAKPGGTPP
jgi:hypothetical protein